MGGAYDNKSPATIVSATAVLVAVDILVVSTRVYIRRSLKQPYYVEDWLSISALLCVIGMAVALFIGVGKHALGYDTPKGRPLPGHSPFDVVNDKIVTTMKIHFAVVLLSTAALAFVKLSFLFFYHRIFVYDKGNFRNLRNIVIHIMMVLVVLWAGGFMLSHVFGCGTDFYAQWSSPYVQITHCINNFLQLYALAMSDFIMDCLIILIPVPLVWKLHLPRGRKIAVGLVFFMGAVATAASLMRLIFLDWVVNRKSTTGPKAGGDQDQLISKEMFWYMVEVTIALVAVCLPPLSNVRRMHRAENVIRSVRSAWSLGSHRSNRSNLSNPSDKSKQLGNPEEDGNAEVSPLQDVASRTPSRESRTKQASTFDAEAEDLKPLPIAVIGGKNIYPGV